MWVVLLALGFIFLASGIFLFKPPVKNEGLRVDRVGVRYVVSGTKEDFEGLTYEKFREWDK